MRAIAYRGMKIDIGTRAEVFRVLTNFLTTTGQHQVITLNPEYVVLASRQPALLKITQRASLCLVDGIGLALALHRFDPLERYPGADLVPDLCTYSASHQLKVGIVLRAGGLSTPEQVRTALTQKFPSLQVAAWYAGDDLAPRIQQYSPALLLVALGQPQQDLWVAEHLAALPSVRVAIGVGGAIDFLTGARHRAPRLMRYLGLEWVWRLVSQPWRLPRIIRATLGFWYTILFR